MPKLFTADATGNWSFSGTGVVSTNTTYFVLRTNPTGYTSTSSVAGSGNLSTATTQGNDRIQVQLGNTGTYSANNEFHATSVHSTGTVVSCTPDPMTIGGSTTCTATVTDNASSGATAPGGTVTFDDGGAGGSFTNATCTLSGSTPSTSCLVTYTPIAVG